VNIQLYRDEQLVHQQPDVELPWEANKDHFRKVPLPGKRFNRLRVEVTRFHSQGGGLAEIQVMRDGKNLALDSMVKASAAYSHTYSADRAIDGHTSSVTRGHYWLLPNGQTGWIDLYLVRPDWMWLTPLGGTVKKTDGGIALTGPGRGDAEGAVAILPQDLSANFFVRGELYRTGPWAGLVIAHDPETERYISIYARPNDRAFYVYRHEGRARWAAGKLAIPGPPDATWVPFSVARKGNAFAIKIGKTSQLFEAPEGWQGPRFGIKTYHNSSIHIRNLEVIKE
jgi:hypothetical protein